MGKKIFRRDKHSSLITREEIKNYYLLKYFNLYMNLYDFDGIDYQQKDFLLRKMWANGKLAFFVLKNESKTVSSQTYPAGSLVITPFAANTLNIYDFPVLVSLIRLKDASFIPTELQLVDKDVVIGYAQRNKRPILDMVDFLVEKICDVEMTLRTALKSQKLPWVIGYSPETELQRQVVSDMLEQDEPQLFMEIDNVNNFKALSSGAPYICDKLYQLRESYENELREYFGINNLGINEKKEHLIGDEINVNNEQIKRSGECLFDTLNELCERIRDVLGYNISIRYNQPLVDDVKEEEPMKEEEQEDEIL